MLHALRDSRILFEGSALGSVVRHLLHRVITGPRPYASGCLIVSVHDRSAASMPGQPYSSLLRLWRGLTSPAFIPQLHFFNLLGSPLPRSPSLFSRLLVDQVEMASLDSSSDIRFVPFIRSGGTSLGSPKASTSGSSSRAPSPIDAKSQRDLKVIKAYHDFDSIVPKGHLLRSEKCIPGEYTLPMDLASLHGMPKVYTGKSTPVTRATSSPPEVEKVHMEIALRTSPTPTTKKPAEKSALQQEDSAQVQNCREAQVPSRQ
ncbi:hypothetical protein B296_00025042 [Ensete ventricosum]|uniref:Uncharacterized protein n=1 Tax=Ensete ventricosum TaxID=4639 RepID=A0A427AHF1_ENSVE|nr:hypothetical protein B296_00025042 [Ensete ventricosum]